MTATNNIKTMVGKETFETPAFKSRVRSMLKLDFYRLFHTPVFYIMLLIAAIIPAMVLSLSGVDMSPPTDSAYVSSSAQEATMPIFDNAWQVVESGGGIDASTVDDGAAIDMGQFMSINMLFIFAGLLMSIFIAHDYSSGFIKSVFTVHSKRVDYVISKTAIGFFSGAGMIITYVIGTVLAGALTGKAFDVNVSGLIFCLISKTLLMGVFCSLFLSVAVFFKNKLWMTIVFTFLFGMMLYPAASVATLSSTFITVLIALLAGVGGSALIGIVSTRVLERRDLT